MAIAEARWLAAVADAADRVAERWLWVVNAGLALFVSLAFLAPILDLLGLHAPASGIYLVYRAACHQLPQRSYFLGGRSLTYDWPTVRDHLGLREEEYWTAFHHPIRDPVLGYQVAMCQRDLAIFGAMLVTGVALALVSRRRDFRGLPLPFLVLATIPAALDGVSQLLGLRESTAVLRTATGALFGAAVALVVLPMLREGVDGAARIEAAGEERSPGEDLGYRE
jgi:uncharacterized membrane protein